MRERWGGLTRSPRKPRELVEADYTECGLLTPGADGVPLFLPGPTWPEYPGVPRWIQIPDAFRLCKDIPIKIRIKMLMEYAAYFHMVARLLFGVSTAKVHAYVNAMLVKKWAATLLGLQVGKVLAIFVPAIVFAAITYYTNPTLTDLVTEEVSPWRYFGQYEERLWWFDLVGISATGVGYYQQCAQIEGVAFTTRRREWTPYGPLDYFDMGHTWRQEKLEFFNYREWRWSHVWADFIGLMTHRGGGRYTLRAGFRDDLTDLVSWPWLRDPENVCWCARQIP